MKIFRSSLILLVLTGLYACKAPEPVPSMDDPGNKPPEEVIRKLFPN